MKRKLFKYLLILLSLIVLSEIGLRIFLDNAARVLYQKDEACEYRLVPNQNISRFHNEYQTNSYGMRSGEIRSGQKKRILFFGDSVLNGGSKIDQADLLTQIVEEKLNSFYNVEIGTCNISANSWGPENAFRYLQTYIDFDFDLIVLVFNSHDFHDNMHFKEVVGKEPAWPDSQPYLAITDFLSGYFVPKIESVFGSNYDYLEGFDDSQTNPGWKLFIDYARANNKELLFYHHPDANELKNGTYTKDGQLLEAFMIQDSVKVIDGLDHEIQENFIDNIHLNKKGHAKIADVIFDEIKMKNLLAL